MKRIATLLFLLIFSAGFSQKTFSLKIKTDDKPSPHGFSYWMEYCIKGEGEIQYQTLHLSNPDVATGLKPGTYKVSINSVFNHSVSKPIKIKKNTKLNFTGLNSIYSFVPNGICLSERMKESDTVFVIYNTNGGANISFEKIALVKNGGKYIAIQFKGMTDEVFQQMEGSDSFLKALITFEKTAQKLHSPKAITAPQAGITTICLKHELNNLIIPGNWDGFDNLKSIWFLTEK